MAGGRGVGVLVGVEVGVAVGAGVGVSVGDRMGAGEGACAIFVAVGVGSAEGWAPQPTSATAQNVKINSRLMIFVFAA